MGRNAAAFENFPVLIKLIDAKEALSIQVHPSDAYALQVEHEYGKTEMWVVIDCDPGATLYFGVNRPVSREEFQRRVQEGTVTQVLDQVEVRPGDVFFIQAGTIHAIGAGILICEIQQNSNCTYRVYDYGRLGADGKPRELHIQKALDVCRLTPEEGVRSTGPVYPLAGGTAQELGRLRLLCRPAAPGGARPDPGGGGRQLCFPVGHPGQRCGLRPGKFPGFWPRGQPVPSGGGGKGAHCRGRPPW